MRIRTMLRIMAGLFFLAAGVLHFVRTPVFEKIVPPFLPHPHLLVYISGVAELAGGLGLLTLRWRRSAAWGLTALLIAVFPANVYMAMNSVQVTTNPVPDAVLWLRLPVQGMLVWWVWVSVGERGRPKSPPAINPAK